METITTDQIGKIAHSILEKVNNELAKVCETNEILKEHVLFVKDETHINYSLAGIFVINVGSMYVKNTIVEAEIKKIGQ